MHEKEPTVWHRTAKCPNNRDKTDLKKDGSYQKEWELKWQWFGQQWFCLVLSQNQEKKAVYIILKYWCKCQRRQQKKLKMIYSGPRCEELWKRNQETGGFLFCWTKKSLITKIICRYYGIKINLKQNKTLSKKIIANYLTSNSYQNPSLKNKQANIQTIKLLDSNLGNIRL